MSEALNLREIEKRAYLAYSNDGLLDVFLGGALILLGLGMATKASHLAAIAPVVLILLWGMTKKLITAPRIGHVTFGPRRQGRLGRERQFFLVFFTITAILGVGMFWLVESDSEFVRRWMGAFVLASLGLISIGGLSGLAWWKQIPRYYGYALAILVVIVAGSLISLSPPLFLVVPGVVIFLGGLIVLVRFLRRYPRTALEESPDAR